MSELARKIQRRIEYNETRRKLKGREEVLAYVRACGHDDFSKVVMEVSHRMLMTGRPRRCDGIEELIFTTIRARGTQAMRQERKRLDDELARRKAATQRVVEGLDSLPAAGLDGTSTPTIAALP